jgi:hypothetical protein
MIPDPAFYADCLRAAFDDLKAAALAPPKPAHAPKAVAKKPAPRRAKATA